VLRTPAIVRAYALVPFLLALVLVPAAQATPSWLGPQTVSGTGTAVRETAAAMSSNGDIVVAWPETTGTIVANVRPTGGSFSGPIVVASEPGDALYSVGAAINASGEIVIAWQNLTTNKYEASIRPPGGAFSAPIELAAEATHSAFVTPVGIDDAGDVIVGVYTYNGTNAIASYAWRPAGGSFSLLPLNEPFNTNAVVPAVAIDRAGDAIAAWADKTSSGKYLVKAVRRPAGGSFGPPQTLSDSAQDGYEPAVAIAAGGQSAVVWTHVDEESHNRIQASTSTGASGALSSPQTLSRRGSNGEYPAVAVSAGGQAVAVWSEAGIGEIAGGPVGSGFGPVTDLVPDVSQMEVAIDDAGDATAVWGRSESGDTIETATRSAAGAVALSTIVSTAGDSFDVFANVPSAFIGMDSAGDAVVGWSRLNEGSAQANIFDATPPTLVANVPAGATAGQPVSFSAGAGDLFSAVGAPTWSFGDGSTATGSSPTHVFSTPGTYTVTTTVTDAVGNAGSVSHQITVAPAPIVPCAASASGAGCGPLRAACVVPSLKGLTAAAAKARLLAAHCALGKVSIARRYKHIKRLVVSTQSVRAHTTLAVGTKVAVSLKPPPPPRRKKKHRR
jgi:plastocyanin